MSLLEDNDDIHSHEGEYDDMLPFAIHNDPDTKPLHVQIEELNLRECSETTQSAVVQLSPVTHLSNPAMPT